MVSMRNCDAMEAKSVDKTDLIAMELESLCFVCNSTKSMPF